MATIPADPLGPVCFRPFFPMRRHTRKWQWRVALLAPAMLGAALLFAQATPHIAAVDPTSGKTDDNVTVTGASLGKATVGGVFLSDDKNDFRAVVESQADDKIVMKVPKVKAGDYHISLQTGDKLLIMPVRFTVNE